MAKRGKALRGTRITGEWSTGKKCEITGSASIADVRECARVCSSHFFEPGTMRFFKSRVSDYVYADRRGGAYFVTSEQGPSGIRAYSVRHYGNCRIKTVGEFQGYKTGKAAREAAKRLAAGNGSLGGRRR